MSKTTNKRTTQKRSARRLICISIKCLQAVSHYVELNSQRVVGLVIKVISIPIMYTVDITNLRRGIET